MTAIEMLIEPRTAKVGSGSVRRVLPFRKRRMIGPFIFADLIGPETLAVGERFIWWNFVHSDRDRIEAAKAEWTEQRFPTVPGDHDPWVPLPV